MPLRSAARRVLYSGGARLQASNCTRPLNGAQIHTDTMLPPRIRLRRYVPVAFAALALYSFLPDHSRKTPESNGRATMRSQPGASWLGVENNSPTSNVQSEPPSIQSAPTSTLLRTYLVYTLCSFPTLIDIAPSLLHSLTHSPIPGLARLTESVVRHTFFAQFVPGETVAECRATMETLRANGVGSVLNYSAEAEVADVTAEAQRYGEVERALDEGGAFEDWVFRQGGEKGITAFALKIVSSSLGLR